MPSKTKRQARFMAAAAHDAGFAKKAGIDQSVAREFNQADSGGTLLRLAMTGRTGRTTERTKKRKRYG